MNIILFGFKKCGKTYYGMKVAQKLHMDFVESDHLIEQVYTEQYHQTLSYREIAKKHGFPFFRKLEEPVVSYLLQKRNTVISLGGGVVLNPENVLRLKQIGLLVYLDTPKNLLKERLLSSDVPDYLDLKNTNESFDAFHLERSRIYEKISPHIVHTENKTEEEIINSLCDIIAKTKPERKKDFP